jgi:hypothetical protein
MFFLARLSRADCVLFCIESAAASLIYYAIPSGPLMAEVLPEPNNPISSSDQIIVSNCQVTDFAYFLVL